MEDNSVGRRFKQLIDNTGKSQKEMAKLLNTSAVLISNIVSGKRGLGPDIQRRLRESGFDVDWLLTGRKDFNNGAERGSMIASYFFADLEDIVVEKETKQDGVYVKIYKIADAIESNYGRHTNLRAVAEPIEEFEEIKQEVIHAPVSKVLPAAATSIHKHTK